MAFPITPLVFHVALGRMFPCPELGIAGVSLVSLPIQRLKISENIEIIIKHKNQTPKEYLSMILSSIYTDTSYAYMIARMLQA